MTAFQLKDTWSLMNGEMLSSFLLVGLTADPEESFKTKTIKDVDADENLVG